MSSQPTRVLFIGDRQAGCGGAWDLLSRIPGGRYQVEWAATCEDGLRAISQADVDVCLLASDLASGDGLALLAEASRLGCRTPIIVLTEGGEAEPLAIEAGAADHLSKGQLDAPLLERSIRRAIERAHAQESVLRQTAVVDGINRVLRETVLCESEESVCRVCLAVAEQLTGSRFGWIGEVNRDGRLDTIALSDPGWSACTMPAAKPDKTRMINNVELRGIWAEVLRSECSLIVNEPGSHPAHVGTPEGHPPLTSFLGVPLKQGGKTFGMISLANKPGGYDSSDREDVEALSACFVQALMRTRAEDAVRCSEERFRDMFEHLGDAVIIHDFDGRLLEANPEACVQTGHSRDELLALPVAELATPDHAALFAERMELLQHVGQAVYDSTRVGPDGAVIPVEISCRIVDYQGRPAVLSVSRDVRERKRAEAAARREMAKLSAMISGMDQGVAFADPDGRIIEVNDSFAGFAGRCREALVGCPIWECPLPGVGERLPQMIDRFHAAQDAPAITIEGSFERTEVLIRVQPIYSDGHYDGLVLTIINVTEPVRARREAERMNRELSERARELEDARLAALNMMSDMQQAQARLDAQHLELRAMYQQMQAHQAELRSRAERLMAANAELEEANRRIALHQDEIILASKLASIGTMAAGIAHEINNPLVAIAGYSESLLDKLAGVTAERLPDVEHYRKRLDIINEEAFRCKRITQGLLGFARESALVDVRTFDVREAIERAVTLLHAHPSHSPGTSARVQLDPDAIPVCGDRNRLVQVFLNLGKNAFDAMAPGAMLLITARRAGEGVEIVFADEGRGMDQETLSRVFDPFYTTKAVGQGTGLGLAVAKGIVEAMSGHIGIESEVGKGTTVTVLLPLASDTEAKAAA